MDFQVQILIPPFHDPKYGILERLLTFFSACHVRLAIEICGFKYSLLDVNLKFIHSGY